MPALQGGWLKAYTALWIALAAIAFVMTGLNAWKGFEPFEHTYGHYGLVSAGSGDRIGAVVGSEAIAKGFKAGDTILAINEVPMEEIGTGYLAARKALIREEGEAIAFTVRNAKGNVRTERLTRLKENTRLPETARKLSLGLNLATDLAFLCAAILLFRRRCEPVPALLALGFTMILVAPNLAVNVWLDQASLAAGLETINIFGNTLLLLGLLAFPEGRMSRIAWLIGCALLVCGAITALLPAIKNEVALPIFAAMLAVAVVRQILRYRRLPDGITRQQIRWSIFGFAVGAMLLVIQTSLGLVNPLISPTSPMLASIAIVAGNLSGVCLAAGLVISLMRYRLYDADTVIGRSAAYGVLTLGFLALFAGSQEVIEALSETYFGDQIGALAGGMAAAIATVLVVPLHRRANEWAERRFQKELVRLRRELPRLVSDLRETATTDRIAEIVAERAAACVKATHAAVLVGPEVLGAAGVSSKAVNHWLAQGHVEETNAKDVLTDRLFPHRLALDCEGVGRVGWLLLGPHADGSRLVKDERNTLAEIAEPVARALAISQSRDFERRQMGAILTSFNERVRALEEMVVPRAGEAPALA
ncbi:hypothetical protein G7A66_03150 [Altererythrobacter sp. SALINAS58]|uniref:hypothetical protein n=1 Tax=Alteripontixanthobacter muriae TaxID=2705546 RepID=UPI00157544D6|nr:hypothetical protein [Alteripontixanthobacter muriae]NTZ42106.1 hypothetical protein [Alteripontixanthobacter muriae]